MKINKNNKLNNILDKLTYEEQQQYKFFLSLKYLPADRRIIFSNGYISEINGITLNDHKYNLKIDDYDKKDIDPLIDLLVDTAIKYFERRK